MAHTPMLLLTLLMAGLGSTGHRANIENCQLRSHGVGLVGSRWTHVLVTL